MLLSEIHPSIYRLSVGVHRAERRLDWLRQAGPEADADAPAVTPHTVVRHSSPLLRKLGAVDPALQRSKVGNLRLAAATIDGRVLAPGATFSFWRCIGNPSARRGYGPGLVLVHGRMSSAVGGGLCQLANLLHWMVLHTPLVIVEHHHHGYDRHVGWNGHSATATRCPSMTAAWARRGVTQSPTRCTSNGASCSSRHSSSSGA